MHESTYELERNQISIHSLFFWVKNMKVVIAGKDPWGNLIIRPSRTYSKMDTAEFVREVRARFPDAKPTFHVDYDGRTFAKIQKAQLQQGEKK